MPKHVTFNPYVQYQPFSVTTTKVNATEQHIIPLSDKQSYLRNRKPKRQNNVKSMTNEGNNRTEATGIVNRPTGTSLSSFINIKSPNNMANNYLLPHNISQQFEPVEAMDIDLMNEEEPMDIGFS